MRKVIGIGETVLDIIFKNDQPIGAVPGGSVFNGIISLGRSGVPASFISETGNDRVGERIISFSRENGVNADNIAVYPESKSPVSLAFLDEKNDAEYIFYKDHPHDQLDFVYPDIEPDDIVMFGSYYAVNPVIRPQMAAFLDHAKNNGAIIYYPLQCIIALIGAIFPYILTLLILAIIGLCWLYAPKLQFQARSWALVLIGLIFTVAFAWGGYAIRNATPGSTIQMLVDTQQTTQNESGNESTIDESINNNETVEEPVPAEDNAEEMDEQFEGVGEEGLLGSLPEGTTQFEGDMAGFPIEFTITKNDKTPSRIEVGLSDKVFFKGVVESVGQNVFTASFGDWIESFELSIPDLQTYDSISFTLDKTLITAYAFGAAE